MVPQYLWPEMHLNIWLSTEQFSVENQNQAKHARASPRALPSLQPNVVLSPRPKTAQMLVLASLPCFLFLGFCVTRSENAMGQMIGAEKEVSPYPFYPRYAT